MTGPEHYRAAEQLLATGRDIEDWEGPVAAAQVHATLALAAAAALPSGLFDDWRAVAEFPGPRQTGDPS